MPQNHSSSQRAFNASLFEPGALAAPGGLQTALGFASKICHEDDPIIMEMVAELNRYPYVLEYILSASDDPTYERLSKSIIVQFPTPTTPNILEALGIKLLQRLSASLTSVEVVSKPQHCKELRAFRKKIALAMNVLTELSGCMGKASAGADRSPVSPKRLKGRARRVSLNPDPFNCMKIATPATENQARVVCSDILLQLQGVLGHYLLVLRRPWVPDVFKHQFEDPGTPTTSPECTAQMIRAGLYLENADGFGAWRVILSANAQRYLRKARRDGAIFDIVVKKIKELSHGHFSGDNQKRLIGPKTIIPVYEAKMTGNTRLVYHINCVPNGEGEIQAIRVFGVYTHAQLDQGSFWDTINSQLQNRSLGYVARCNYRGKPLNTRDYVIHPASFSHSSVQEPQEMIHHIKAPEVEMVEVLEEYEDGIEPKVFAEPTRVAKTNYFKHGKIEKAEEFFSSKEDAITFAKDYRPEDARFKLLHTSGMVLESAEVLTKSGKIAEAVNTLLTTPTAPGHKRCAVGYLLAGFWECQSFGTEHSTTNPEVVSELLALADTLRDDMHQPEAREFSMLKARHRADFKTLHSLYPKFIKDEHWSAALLCLDPIFASTLPAKGVPMVADPGPDLSLHLTYFELLDRLRREDRLDTGSIRQRVFAFQPREDDRFFIPTNSFLHEVLLPNPDVAQERNDCIVTHEELRRVFEESIPVFIHDRAKRQHNVYRRRLGTLPCMMYVTRGECQKADCQYQHLRQEKITTEWFNARVRLVLTEIRILNFAGFHPKGVIIHWVCTLYSVLHPPLPKLGSVATLDLGNTPESADGMRILREWIWQACDRLLPNVPPWFEYNETFIPDFMQISMMAYDFDFERAQEYIPRTRMCRWEKWPACLTRPGVEVKENQFIVNDFVQFLHGGQHHSLILGTLYLGQVLARRIPVEVGPFCDAVEKLCGLFILAYRFNAQQGSLHDVILPRSWFIGLSRFLQALDKNTSYLRRFVEITVEFLQRLDSQREQCNSQQGHSNLRQEQSDPWHEQSKSQANPDSQFKYLGLNIGPMYASVYIVRICLCLCLLAYNSNHFHLTQMVVQAIHGLQREGGVTGIYQQYTEAQDWLDLVKVFTKSLSDSTLDEMIQLSDSKAGKFRGWAPSCVRNVRYGAIEEIPDRVRVKPGTRTGADSPPGLPTPGDPPVESVNNDGQEKPSDLPEDILKSSDNEVPVDGSGQDEVSTSPEEVQAYLKIAAVYYRVLERRKEALKGIDATRARLWFLLHRRVSSMDWQTQKKYRLLMQGPLVHVLVCLDAVKLSADQINKESKEQLKGGDRKKFEELMDRSDRSSELRRDAAELQTKLGHLSSLHDRRDVSALKAAVLEVKELLSRLVEFPVPAATETKKRIRDDWKLGWDGIIRGPVKVQKAERPKSNLKGKGL